MALYKENQQFKPNIFSTLQEQKQPFEATSQFKFVIQKIQNTTNSTHLDPCFNGSMASQTAEACYDTLMSGLRYTKDYLYTVALKNFSQKLC